MNYELLVDFDRPSSDDGRFTNDPRATRNLRSPSSDSDNDSSHSEDIVISSDDADDADDTEGGDINVLDTDFFLENIQSPFKIEFFPSKPRSRFQKIICSINVAASTLFSLVVIGIVIFASLEMERKLPTAIIICYSSLIGVSIVGMGFSWYYTLRDKIWRILFVGIITATIDIVLIVASRLLR